MMTLDMRVALKQHIEQALGDLFDAGYLSGHKPDPIELSPPKDPEHGDFACAIALILARSAGKNPREIATKLHQALGDAGGLLTRTEIAGPGFLNLFVSDKAWRNILSCILKEGAGHIRPSTDNSEKILLEYVSANPTGPLHIGHGRGAVIGDIVARLLRTAGYDVTREYYINDFGHQVDVMARSVYLRYEEACGVTRAEPDEFYPGAYIADIAQDIYQSDGAKWMGKDESHWIERFRSYGIEIVLARIKDDLEAFGITFDNYQSEHALLERIDLPKMITRLQNAGHIYESEGKQWFRSTDFGDTKDRVITRDDGRTTYFASDIAYHDDKLARGYRRLINVWGADHGGYITRVKAGIEALGYTDDPMEVISIQMVSLSRGGETVRMGKRLGTAVWLRDVVAEAGRDATRYFFAMRRPQSQMDFDLDLATKKSLDNPVYYAQMGHARMCSIAKRALEAGIPKATDGQGALDALILPEEIGLIKKLSTAPQVIALAAKIREPHHVVHYIQELIGQFHSYYTQYKHTERVISDDPKKTRARLLLCHALQVTLHTLLVDVLGVSAPESMYLDKMDAHPSKETD